MKPDFAERNINLVGEFMRYILDNPKILDALPDNFELVILPEDNPGLCMFNLELLDKYGSEGKPVVIVRAKVNETVLKSVPSIYVPVAT